MAMAGRGLTDVHSIATLILNATALLLATILAYFVYRGYVIRSMFRRVKDLGIPIMPHSFLFGHLIVVGEMMSKFPGDAHGDHLQMVILKNWQKLFPGCTRCPSLAYVDVWPFAAPLIVSLDGDVTAQFTQDQSRPKPPQQKHFLTPLTRNLDITSMEGSEWKTWRRRLNPGFSLQSVTSRVPDLVEEVDDFIANLRQRTGPNGTWGPVFQLESEGTNLTLDVIGRYLLDVRLYEQSGTHSPLSAALLDCLPMLRFYFNILSMWTVLNPWRAFKFWYNRRIMDGFLVPLIHNRILVRSNAAKVNARDQNQFISLLLSALEEEEEEEGGLAKEPDQLFVDTAVGHIKFFLFAGHDTTAFTLAWAFHRLSRNPDVLTRLRAELDAILGPDPSADAASQAFKAQPQLVNQLTYTNAVLKEAMRMHTNIGTFRYGGPDFFLIAPPDGPESSAYGGGTRCPTDGFLLWDGNWAIHMDPARWHRVDEFLPERWLTTDPEDVLHPPKNAWRAFEQGARHCIGQSLAMAEMKLVLALTVREFDIEEAWDKWDAKRGNKTAQPGTVWGERLYQVNKDGPPHVKDGMPVHVRSRTAALR